MTAPTMTGAPGAVERAVRTYLDHLVVERGVAANTLSSYRRDLRRYRAYLAERGITDLTQVGEGVVADFLVRLREGDAEHQALSSTSAARTLVAVRGFHRFAVADGLVEHDPAAGVRPPQPAKRLPKALPLADQSSASLDEHSLRCEPDTREGAAARLQAPAARRMV
ncbi:MAG: site-specific integrase, partial [Nocardioides sp.]